MTSSKSQAHAHDASAWSSHAKTWTSSTQQITRAPCLSLLSQVSDLVPFTPSNDISAPYVLDDGAGAGMVTFLLKEKYPQLHILAADVSPGMLDSLREKDSEIGIADGLETQVLDAQDLNTLPDAAFSHVLCTFVTSFLKNPLKALCEMYRVTRPGGVVGLATWSRVSWVPVWEKTVRSLGQPDYKAPALFHPQTTEVDDVRRHAEEAGWTHIELRTFACDHPEKTPEEATEEFYGMGNPSVKLLMEGFETEFLERSKEVFRGCYGEVFEGGRKRQSEVAILMVGKKEGTAEPSGETVQ